MTFDEAIHAIETEDTGEEVAAAVIAALQSLARRTTVEVDISEEIAIIRDNVSGNKVRLAIRDALAKISAAIMREYVISFEWYETIEEYNELETHDSEVLYAIGGTEGTVSSYERVFKGDVELQKVMRGTTMIWSKPDIPPVFEFDETMITVVALDANYERDRILYTCTSESDAAAFMYNHPESILYEVYYGHDWMENHGGVITYVGFGGLNKVNTITLPNNTVTIPNGWMASAGYFRKCILTNTRLTTIPGGAFYGCGYLEDIGVIPATVTSIIGGAFAGCTSAGINITIADGDEPLVINDSAFGELHPVKTMGIPSRTTQLGSNAFYHSDIQNLIIAKEEGSLDGYPWGATSIDNIWWMGDPDES